LSSKTQITASSQQTITPNIGRYGLTSSTGDQTPTHRRW